MSVNVGGLGRSGDHRGFVYQIYAAQMPDGTWVASLVEMRREGTPPNQGRDTVPTLPDGAMTFESRDAALDAAEAAVHQWIDGPPSGG